MWRPAAVLAAATYVILGAVALAAPRASFDFAPSDPEPQEAVTFTSTSSPEPGGGITNYAWDLDGDGQFGEAGEPAGRDAKTATRAFPAAGDYVVRCASPDRAARKTSPRASCPSAQRPRASPRRRATTRHRPARMRLSPASPRRRHRIGPGCRSRRPRGATTTAMGSTTQPTAAR